MKDRLLELVAIVVIGDGVVGLALPRRHVNRWRAGPGGWRSVMRPFVEHPRLTQVAGAVEVAVGLVVAARLPARR